MQFEGQSILLAILLALAMIGLAEWSASHSRKAIPESGGGGGIVESSIFALLGLLLAFAFTGAAGRLDARRDLVIDEANALGTAALRLDLLPDPTLARQSLSAYIDSRFAYGQVLRHQGDLKGAWSASQAAQQDLWQTVLISSDSTIVGHDEALILAPLNEAFDLAAKRHVMVQVHLPWPVEGLLTALALLCAWLGGRALPGRDYAAGVTRGILAVVIAATILLIKDLDHPRLGFIRVDGSDQLLREVKDSLK